MIFDTPLQGGQLIRRYKRFLADITLDSGERITAHCPNTGSMMGCAEPGSRVWVSRSDNPRRKYAYTWELVEVAAGVVVGVHTGRANALVEEALLAGRLPALRGYRRVRREVRVVNRPMRADLLLGDHSEGEPDCLLEVKNVTAAVADGVALFPDAVSARGTRHLDVLAAEARAGRRTALVFCVQRPDVREVHPADAIDRAYGQALRAALADGMEAYALQGGPSPEGIELTRELPVHCP
ncbi:DNA/RNA nuclease SfsA [Alkalilimnicola ehrlichii MLHE-1]|uniref:Sugar fermentation stimulation protein homolog n=1 Tax=Alkalilimnicola ehrlichii (strain ATCC BAA-1101 / DSM 17681 / MLHE-1) TaxID=187272 RepID=SFSA_ALKEH|nr:DNA/RNA nuclease SfsA [Alkalilimnicola ehrlichii]Q0A8P7.1 RecName: Full=Sugar fermentation stimulation protein homolog [Alkalilimnicola ehrlichii MLHE-1]ABI56790.1 sugar fermentation stimulation protein [Alkalilimnicola ehrlichii MLHE-1]